MRDLSVCLSVCLSVLLIACGPGEDEALSRDRANGDTVLLLGELPEVDIGGLGDVADTLLMIAAAATRLSSGVIVVADPYAPAVRYFAPTGELLRSVGRRGDGPGEFQAPWWLRQCGPDSVFVWDAYQGRVTVLDEVGALVREFQFDSEPALLECSRSGVFAAIGTTQSPQARLGTRLSGPVMVLDRDGQVLRSFDEMPYFEIRPMGRVTSLAMSDSFLFVGTGDSAFVEVYDPQVGRVGGVGVGEASRKPTDRQYDRAIEAAAAQFSNHSDRESAKAMQRQLFASPPDELPSYSALQASSDGVLWAVTSFPGDSITVLQAVNAVGDLLGSVRIPIDLKIFEIGTWYVLGTYETELGVPHVVMYRMEPRS
ncbi:MAG TPA: hypothetical protein VLH75_03040 [Longimicrobiales bacterium]|nr:hypothetical protein [Longimicrobiales bacterium]